MKKLNGMENVTRHMAYEFEAQTERKIWLKLHTSLNGVCLNNITDNQYNYPGPGQGGSASSSGAVVLNVICQMMEYMFH